MTSVRSAFAATATLLAVGSQTAIAGPTMKSNSVDLPTAKNGKGPIVVSAKSDGLFGPIAFLDNNGSGGDNNGSVVVAIGNSSAADTQNGPVTYTVTYTGSVSQNLEVSDITLNKTGTADGTVSVADGTTTTPDVTISGITGDGTLDISIGQTTARDANGDGAPAAGPSGTFNVDNTDPTVSISAPSVTDASGGPVTYTVTYSGADSVTLSAGDLSLITTGTALGSIAVSGSGNTTRTVTISSILGNGTIGFNMAANTASDNAGNQAPAAGPSTAFNVDNTPPTIAISAPSTTDATTGPVTFTVTYTGADSVTLANGDISLDTTGTATGTATVSGSGTSTRTVTVSGITGDGTIGISIAANTASDNAGNQAPAAGPSGTFNVDNTGPGVAIGAPSVSDTMAGPVTYTITYTDASAVTLASGDVTLNTTGTATGTVAVSGSGTTTRTVTISGISGDGTLGISLAANTATDASGNQSASAGPSATFNVDNTAPSITSIQRFNPAAEDTAADVLVFRVSFDESVTGVGTGDFRVDGTTTATVTTAAPVSGAVYDVTVSGGDLADHNGRVGLNLAASPAINDEAGNALPPGEPGTDETFNVDNADPTISIGAPSASDANTGPVTFTVTYTGADSVTLANGDITVNSTGTAAAGSVNVTGSGTTTRTVTLSTLSGDGTLGISIAANTASDNAGNQAPSAGPSTTFNVDNTPPGISVSAASATHTRGGPVTYTVTYTDADSVTLANGDVTLNTTGTATGSVAVSGSGTATRTVTISSIAGDGTLGISIAAGTAGDVAGNTAVGAGPSGTFIVDNTAPTTTIGAPSVSSVIASSGATVTYTITYADAVGIAAVTTANGDLTLNRTGTANGTASVTATGATTATVTINSITGEGTLGISVAANTAADAAGNQAPAAGPSATFNVVTPEIVVHDGATTADASIANNGASTAIGTTPFGVPITKTFNIENTGSSPLNVSLTTMPAEFSLSGAFPSTIGVGSSDTFVVQLDATTVGAQSGNIVIDTDDVDEDPFTFQVSGTVNKADPTVTITSDNPDHNHVSQDVTVNFTVTPPGNGTPTGNVIVSDDTGVSTTVDVSTGTATLSGMPVGNRTITAAYQGDANFNAANDTEPHETRGPDIVLLGNSIEINDGDTTPALTDHTDFGSSGSYPWTVTRTFTIRNDGNETLNLSANPLFVNLTGDTGAYTVTQPAVTALAPAATTTFTITIAPEIAGPLNCTVSIDSDDASKATFDFAITGMIIPSAIDTTYNPGIGPNEKVFNVAVQPDGKAVIGGAFITYNNISRKYVARVNVDGSLDTTFDPGGGASHHVNAVDIHTEGKILIGGRFQRFDGATVGRVARLNTDGSLDNTFQTVSGGADNEVLTIHVQPDQRILIGGDFQSVNGVSRNRVARLNADGTLDTTFNVGQGPDGRVRFIELQADGKILVGGHFRLWGGDNNFRIIRLNSDGSVDGSFSSPLPNNGYVSEIIKDEDDGDIYVSGGTRRLLRLNNDGSVQWQTGLNFDSDPNAILLTQDGKIITGGYFRRHGTTTRTRLARIDTDGSLDAVFDPDQGADRRFRRLALQPDGRIIGVGEFRNYRGQTRNFITRMINDIRIGPFFSLEPVTSTVELGTTFTLTSMAEGQAPVTYQWQKDSGGGFVDVTDGGVISGATTKDLTFTAITATEAGSYRVIATNPNGTATSVTVVITVQGNQAPTIDALADLTLTEDDPQQTVNLSGISEGAAHESYQTLTITATSSDTSIIPDPTVTFTEGDTTGTLTFTPVADAHTTGTPVTITVNVADNGTAVPAPGLANALTTTITFDVTVTSVNDTPTLTITPTTFSPLEDSGSFSQPGFATFSKGPANESAQTLTLTINNSNPGIFAAGPAIDAAGELTFTPAADAFGTATVTVFAQDNGGGADTSPTRTFTINVLSVNDQPNFTLDVSNLNFVENSGFNQVTIITSTTRGPANETTQKVDRYEIVGNTNPGLLTGLEISSNGILKANTVNGVTGSTVITLQMVDNGGTANGGVDTSATQQITITVGPQNFPPDFDLSGNLFTHLEDSGAHGTANFVSNVGPGDVSEAGQTVTFTITAADPSLFASGPTLTPNGNDYDLSYTLAADASGSTLVTVIGTDDGPGNAAQNKTFTVTITDINDVPSFTVAQATVNANEDDPAQTVAGVLTSISAGPSFESTQTVTVNITANDNPTLFASGPAFDSSGTLTFTLAADANGTANLTVTVSDDGGTSNGGVDTSASQSVAIVVAAVNDTPSFTPGANISHFRGDGAYSAAWATAIDKGAANESAQTLTFNVSNDNNALFDVQPAIASDGTLTFTPAASANGSATVTVTLSDDGGGADTSAQVTFTISISGTKIFVAGNPTLGNDVLVPVDLNGTGNENSAAFTLTYDATQFEFGSFVLGAGAAGASFWFNAETDGAVGVLIVLPTGTTFAAGNNALCDIRLNPKSTATAGTYNFGFSSTPVKQEVTDTSANVITGVLYVGASVTLAEATNEGDVAPRPFGNGSVTVTDATQVGNFAAGLATPNNGGEFQRADTAPAGSLGDGSITVADWVQTLIYAGAGSSPAAGGPTTPGGGGPVLSPSSLTAANTGGRSVSLVSSGLTAGQQGTVSVILNANGDESGVSFSLEFDAASLTFVKAESRADGMLIVNDTQVANGRIGLVYALSPGQSAAAGETKLIDLTFAVAANASGNTAVNIGDGPVVREVADTSARVVPASFNGGQFPVALPVGFVGIGVELVDGAPRFTFGNEDGSAVTAAQVADLEVYATSAIGAAWTRLDNALVIVNGRVQIVDPDAGNGIRFYQVRRTPGGSVDQ